ncbi:MAG TPA: BatA domain-containing protein [Tepidisphaeraceae bacterium]|nr:BatA domain-containing protein [Tepidisphaeraceae bacterium]
MTLNPALAQLPLAFGFLNWPMAAIAAGLISIPIIIHLLNRRRFKTVTWAAMEFLMKAMRKNRRRLEFEQWILLATRCLLVFLLGLALARPLGCEKSSLAGRLAGRTGLNVIVIDNSYSMNYQADRPGAKTHLDQAKKVARGVIDQFTRGGESAVIITAGAPVNSGGTDRSLFKIGYDLDRAKDAVGLIRQSYGGTDLAGALKLALQVGREETREQNKNLYIITDATRGAWEAKTQAEALKQLGPDLAKVFKVTHFNMTEGRQQWNAAVLDVAPVGGLVRTKFDSDFKADVKSFGPPQPATIQWKVDESPLGNSMPVNLDPTTPEQTTREHRPQFTNGGPHLITVTADAPGDRLSQDNVRYHVEDVAADMKVLLVEGKRGAGVAESSGSSLQAALTPAHDAQVKTLSSFITEPISDLELGNRALTDYSAVVLADVGQLTGPEADRLKQYVEQGGTLEIFMGDSVDKNNYNSILLPRKLMPGTLVKTVTTGTDQKPYRFNFKPNAVQNDYLENFRGVENSGLDLVAVRSYWQVELPPGSPALPILKYLPSGVEPGKQDADAPGDPAMTAHSLGQGHVIWVSTTANDEWTDFPAHVAYMPLMQELLAHSVKSGTYWLNLEVGQPLVVPPTVRMTALPTLLDPDKKPVVLESETTNDPANGQPTTVYRSTPLNAPGVYSLSLGTATIPIAVNIPASEADVRTINDQQVRHALGDIDMTLEGDQPPSEAAVAQAGRDWGWHIMVVVLALLGLEAFMAMRFGHWRPTAVQH